MLSSERSHVGAAESDDVERATLASTITEGRPYIPSRSSGEALIIAASTTRGEIGLSVNSGNIERDTSVGLESLKIDHTEPDDLEFKSIQLKRRQAPRGGNDDTGTHGGSGPTRKRPKLAPRMKATAFTTARTAPDSQTDGSSSSNASTLGSTSHSSQSEISVSTTPEIALARKTAGTGETAGAGSVEAEEGKK